MATPPPPDVPDPPTGSPSEAARVADGDAALDHWRTLARQRAGALEDLKRRPLVRAAVAADRRLTPHLSAAAETMRTLRRGSDRLLLRGSAALRRGSAQERLSELAAAVRSNPPTIPPATAAPTVTVIRVRMESAAMPGAGADTAVADLSHSESVQVVDTIDVSSTPGDAARAVADAASSVTSDLVCVVLATTEPLDDSWLERLVAASERGSCAAFALTVHPLRPPAQATPHDGLVRCAGFEAVPGPGGVPAVRATSAGEVADPSAAERPVMAGSAACFVVDRAALLAVGGIAPLGDLDAAVIDLSLRVAGHGVVTLVPGAVVADRRPVPSVRALREPFDETGTAWRELIEHAGPDLWRRAWPERRAARFVVTIAAPMAKVAPRWGDWHLANGLAEALGASGHEVTVQTADRRDDLAGRCHDVHLVLRGLRTVRRTSGQRHVLWVISHPEEVDRSECDEADLVLVASARYADELRGRTDTPVEVVLQATDPARFRPVAAQALHRHPVTIVAKSRDQLRPMVADALAAGLRPAIYGGGWAGLVDPSLVVAEHVANDDLAAIYCSAGVVLNDHWDAMRSAGFVSNRVFDVLACGAPIISDDVAGIGELFGDTVPVARDANELRELVDRDLAEPERARERAARGRAIVLEQHTFARRAEQIDSLLKAHGLLSDL